MFIQDYWENYVGVSDEAMCFVEYLEAMRKGEFTVTELFEETGLAALDGKFSETNLPIGVELGDIEIDFPYAIDIVVVIAAIVLECRTNEVVNLNELNDNCNDFNIKITATDEEYLMLTDALADFIEAPESYDLAEMMDEEELQEYADGIHEMLDEM
ncbi:MAG: imm68 putative immunity domain-containing protein [Clostridia bacterium]|nr:imm68 putative immunity domain-containing protein [Clostridia bacterium]